MRSAAAHSIIQSTTLGAFLSCSNVSHCIIEQSTAYFQFMSCIIECPDNFVYTGKLLDASLVKRKKALRGSKPVEPKKPHRSLRWASPRSRDEAESWTQCAQACLRIKSTARRALDSIATHSPLETIFSVATQEPPTQSTLGSAR